MAATVLNIGSHILSRTMVQFGLTFDFRNPKQWNLPWDTLYGRTLDQISFAEELGYDSVWLTEHHFSEDGQATSPMTTLAAIASRTKRVLIGTSVLLLPFYNASRLAEDAATVDIISGGRLILGLGQGYRRSELEAFGIPQCERLGRFVEGVEVIKKAWEGTEVNFKGKYYTLRNATFTPSPIQKPRPEIWLGGKSKAAARRAAQLGDGFMALNDTQLMQTYRQELRDFQGPDATPRISRSTLLYISEDPDEDWYYLKDHFLYRYRLYHRWFSSEGISGSLIQAGIVNNADELRRANPNIICDVDTCIRLVRDYLCEDDLVHFSFGAGLPGADQDRTARHMELFANKVMSLFRT